ncbi:MAG: phage portal protein [Hyphomonas sp.]|uniref:phage portal protein n=1 Tax=Hyphomonas sp. TaxID=87 RepID=UPI00180A8137|nr:phage portal protein [Hyphomonas sp.]MBA3068180.1 phage portal protein [Hyphomonas sp.]MBU3919842.1 phage portal protein [Alphaproteobacteria bacterium]MBU4062102.1 phage portal protein [Alphaproteobacteria bacterium]MBU4165536.1 phage portal protein [Alphaproteobacteria bacterium]
MLTRILSAFGFERRDYNPAYAPDAWNRPAFAAPYASANAVLSNLAVAARCVSLRSELMASVPLKLYRKLPNGDKERVTDTPLAMVLGDLANPLMTAYELRELLVRSLDLYGNAYARIVRDGAGQVIELWPIISSAVTVEKLESGRLRYRVSQTGNKGSMTLLMEEVLHIRASSEDGMLGRSPIAIARGALNRAIAENEAAQRLATSGHKSAGVLSVPNAKISPPSRKALEDMFEEDASGPGGVGKIKVLEGGAKYISTSWSGADAQFLESREMSNLDVARIFSVPPAALGIQSSVSYGSAAADAQALVQNCLQPLAERVEQAFMRCLLTPEGRRQYVIEHDLRGLLRGNMTERFAAYRIGREIGMYSANDLRRAENESAIADGDSYLQPGSLAGSSAPNTE